MVFKLLCILVSIFFASPIFSDSVVSKDYLEDVYDILLKDYLEDVYDLSFGAEQITSPNYRKEKLNLIEEERRLCMIFLLTKALIDLCGQSKKLNEIISRMVGEAFDIICLGDDPEQAVEDALDYCDRFSPLYTSTGQYDQEFVDSVVYDPAERAIFVAVAEKYLGIYYTLYPMENPFPEGFLPLPEGFLSSCCAFVQPHMKTFCDAVSPRYSLDTVFEELIAAIFEEFVIWKMLLIKIKQRIDELEAVSVVACN